MKSVSSVFLALGGLLVLLATSSVVRGHLRELKGHLEHCKKMCGAAEGGVAATSEQPCRGAAA